MVGFGEILAFDPEQINRVFTVCSAQQQTCVDLGGQVRKLSDLHTWEGDAAAAAKASAGRTRVDLDTHGHEVWKVAAAARDCYDEGVVVKKSAQDCQRDADEKGFVIDPVGGTVTDPKPPVMRGWAEADKASYYAEIAALQGRVNNVLVAADRFDDDLAAAINAADGSLPLTPQGESPNVNLADRQANQVAAFRKTYGKDPTTANDWRMASVLDSHSYLPKNQGVSAEVKIAKFTPQPGRGVVAVNAFIPRSDAYNISSNDLGDNRGFDPTVTPEQSRAVIYVDYDRGMIIARQNPSVSMDGKVAVGAPRVTASQQSDGQLDLRYMFTNPLAPGPDSFAEGAGETVRGSLSLTGGHGVTTVNGIASNYPALEAYQYVGSGDSDPAVAYQFRPGVGPSTFLPETSFGPLLNLPSTHEFGDQELFPQAPGSPHMGYPGGPVPGTQNADGTALGDIAAPPTAKTVETR